MIQNHLPTNVIVQVENRTTTRSEGTSSRSVPSAGIYVIGREQIVKLLRECLIKAKDLASEIIPGAISEGMKVNFKRGRETRSNP